jgi:DnaJ-class molecular chaperone
VRVEDSCDACWGEGMIQQGKVSIPCPMCQGEGEKQKGKLNLTYKDVYKK